MTPDRPVPHCRILRPGVVEQIPADRPSDALDGMRRVDGIHALTLLVDEHGVESVYRWLRNVASIHGHDLPKWQPESDAITGEGRR